MRATLSALTMRQWKYPVFSQEFDRFLSEAAGLHDAALMPISASEDGNIEIAISAIYFPKHKEYKGSLIIHPNHVNLLPNRHLTEKNGSDGVEIFSFELDYRKKQMIITIATGDQLVADIDPANASAEFDPDVRFNI